MSEKLKKLERTELYGLNEYTLAEVLLTLNAAITRINELEGLITNHDHLLPERVTNLEVRYEGHKHGYYIRGENPLGGAATTLPIKDDD